jgi:Retrotransposon gag protein/Zinc knuckle
MLTFCKGTAINEWAAQQGDLIHDWVEGNIAQGLYPTRLDTNETIWTDTEQALLNAFREYHKGETAHQELKKLRQEPGQVEDYINHFQSLLRHSGWTTTDNGTIEAFREGLVPGLLTACHNRSTKPQTLEEWYEAARVKEKSYYALQADLKQSQLQHKGGGFSRLGEMSRDAKSYQKKPREDIDPRPYISMQVDAARMSNKEHQKLLKERACFRCKKTGHFLKDCLLKPKGTFKGKQRSSMKPRPRVRTADTGREEGDNEGEPSPDEEIKDLPPAYAKKDLMAAIKKMKTEDCEELLDQCALDSDQDF